MIDQIWSCGGGTQSAAIAALIVRGTLHPPDRSVIVDTEREKSETWAYFAAVLQPALQRVGVDIVRVRKSEYATVDLYGHNGDLLIPAYTAHDGRLNGFCSNEWKRRVVQRWLRDRAPQDFQRAIALDAMIREEDGNVFVHRSGRPLVLADLEAADPQGVLGCDSGDCFV